MGLYLCKKHGLSGPRLICPHAARAMEGGSQFETTEVGVDALLLPVVDLCRECLAYWQGAFDDEKKGLFLDTLVPVCGKCFDEAKNV
jgi:hypothetical protein